MIESETDSERLADMATAQLRGKILQLRLALEGHITADNRFWLRQMMDHLEFLEAKIFVMEQEIEQRSLLPLRLRPCLNRPEQLR